MTIHLRMEINAIAHKHKISVSIHRIWAKGKGGKGTKGVGTFIPLCLGDPKGSLHPPSIPTFKDNSS